MLEPSADPWFLPAVSPLPPVSDPAARRRAELVLVGITAGWALTFVVVQDALVHAAPFTFVALRFALAAVAGTLLARGRLLDGPTLLDALRLTPFLFGGYALQTLGLEHTTPARSAFLTGLAVVFVPFVAFALTRRWPRPPVLAGVALAVVGLRILSAPEPGGDDTSLGDLLSVGCAVAYAGHLAFNEGPARRRDPLVLVTWQLWGVALLSAGASFGEGWRVDWTPGLAGALAFSGLFASLGFVGLQTWAQGRTSATRAALVFSLEPLFAASYSVALGREPLSAPMAGGGALLVAAIVVAELGGAWWDRRFERVAVAPDA